MRRLLSSCLAVLAATPVAVAQTTSAAQLDSIIRKAVAEKHIVGVSVGVMQNGKVVLAKGYGIRDLSTKSSG